MNKVSGCLDGVKWYRTSKQAARNAYNQGEEVLICAVNLWPFGGWRPGSIVSKACQPYIAPDEHPFDYQVRWYEWYNANCNETGRYAAFYVKVKNTHPPRKENVLGRQVIWGG